MAKIRYALSFENISICNMYTGHGNSIGAPFKTKFIVEEAPILLPHLEHILSHILSRVKKFLQADVIGICNNSTYLFL